MIVEITESNGRVIDGVFYIVFSDWTRAAAVALERPGVGALAEVGPLAARGVGVHKKIADLTDSGQGRCIGNLNGPAAEVPVAGDGLRAGRGEIRGVRRRKRKKNENKN